MRCMYVCILELQKSDPQNGEEKITYRNFFLVA